MIENAGLGFHMRTEVNGTETMIRLSVLWTFMPAIRPLWALRKTGKVCDMVLRLTIVTKDDMGVRSLPRGDGGHFRGFGGEVETNYERSASYVPFV